MSDGELDSARHVGVGIASRTLLILSLKSTARRASGLDICRWEEEHAERPAFYLDTTAGH